MASANKGTRAVVWVIVGLLIVGLMGFSVTNFGGTVTSVGRVGDREIGVQRYVDNLRGTMNALSQQVGQPITFEQAQLFGVDQQALRQTVTVVAIEAEADKLGLSAGDEQVRTTLLSTPAFQGLDGTFDREAYRETLNRRGVSETLYETDLRAEISRSLVQGAVVSGVDTPPVYTDTLLNFIGERRNFAWATLTVEDLAEPIAEPTDADLMAYFEANEADFMLPETRKITYVWLTPEMIVDTVEVDAEDVQQLYDDRIDEFNTPERRLVERLVLGDDAADAKARLDAGEVTFEDLVAERDLTLEDIDMGDVAIGDLGTAGAEIFASNELGVFGPLDSDFGAALYRVNAVLAAQETPFEDAKDDLTRELALEKAGAIIDGQIDEVDDLLAGGATLEEIGAETELELGQVDWFQGAGGGISDFPAFARAAAAAADGDFAEVSQTNDGSIFALRLDEIIEPRLDTFENSKVQADAGWRRVETVAALTAQAEVVAEGLRAGTDPADLGVTLLDHTDITRESFVPEASPALLEEIFGLDAGAVHIFPEDTAVQIVRLDEILGPDPENETLSARRTALDTATARGYGNDILAAFAAAIEADAGITLDQGAINAVHSQIP